MKRSRFVIIERIRFTAVVLLVALAALMSLQCGDGYQSDTTGGTSYYVDSVDGDDAHDGKSELQAWKSIDKVNLSEFSPGDSILFRRGCSFAGGIKLDWSGTVANPIIIDAYGSGSLPVFLGSRSESGWASAGGTIYSKSKSYTPGTTGAGIILQDGVPLKFKPWNTNASTSLGADTGVFTYDPSSLANSVLYVRCTDSAGPDTHQMDAGFDLIGVHGDAKSNIHINNIRFRNYSCHGVSVRNGANIRINNCHAENIGGAILSLSPLLYGGNGFEFTLNSTNCSIKDSTAAQIFDSGFSPQVFETGATTSDIQFENCTADTCGFAGIEISVLNFGGSNNEGLENIHVSGCTVTDSGKGWSGVRYGNEGHGIRIKADTGSGEISGVTVTRSSVSGCAGAGIYIGGETGTVDISRTRITGNTGNGIVCAGIVGVTSMKLRLTSSLVLNHTGQGIGYNVVNGNGFELINNTFYNNNLGIYIGACGGAVVMKNNVFYSSNSAHTYLYSGSAVTSFTAEYNGLYESGGNIVGWNGSVYTTAAGFTNATHSIGSNPLFVNAGTDFRLQSGSPCKNSGFGAGVTVDYEGNAFAATPSRGAYR